MKGNIPINKSIAKGIENGKIFQNLPEVQFGERMVPLFTPIPPIKCSICGSPLNINEHYAGCLDVIPTLATFRNI